jgi:hypothetical protein
MLANAIPNLLLNSIWAVINNLSDPRMILSGSTPKNKASTDAPDGTSTTETRFAVEPIDWIQQCHDIQERVLNVVTTPYRFLQMWREPAKYDEITDRIQHSDIPKDEVGVRLPEADGYPNQEKKRKVAEIDADEETMAEKSSEGYDEAPSVVTAIPTMVFASRDSDTGELHLEANDVKVNKHGRSVE